MSSVRQVPKEEEIDELVDRIVKSDQIAGFDPNLLPLNETVEVFISDFVKLEPDSRWSFIQRVARICKSRGYSVKSTLLNDGPNPAVNFITDEKMINKISKSLWKYQKKYTHCSS